MQVTLVFNEGNEAVFTAESLTAPTTAFHYWVIWPMDNPERECYFFREDIVAKAIMLSEEEEVPQPTEGNVLQLRPKRSDRSGPIPHN
jgi:hypothetical protein